MGSGIVYLQIHEGVHTTMKRYLIIHEDPDTGVQTVMKELHILGRYRIPIEIEIDAESRQEAIEKFLDSNLVLIPMSEFKAAAIPSVKVDRMKYIQELIGNGNVPDTI